MRQFKAIHALFIVNGLHLNNYAISKLISFCALSNSGSLSYASLIFSQIQNPNLFAYNTLIRAYSRSSTPQLALHYFQLMLDDENACPDSAGSFLRRVLCYGRCRKLFDEIPNLDVVQWNVLLNGYVRRGLAPEALNAFRNMLVSGVEPDEFCLTTALKGCAQLGALQQGKWIHEYVTKRKWLEADVFIGTALVDMYAKCGCIDRSVEVFEGMTKRNVFSWSAMIGALHYMGM
ncbi:Pentatricopeptide repeat-containing protein [Vitis vinifera]|uniref:Pentatricopeptide repeat-containing protein n=1 Tax=Vitis vinifera TaxID=29760 RepID=A0A438CL74_VITVI|nr:Pentatricopeptide repeat-containing protein [Vitis vinifera]